MKRLQGFVLADTLLRRSVEIIKLYSSISRRNNAGHRNEKKSPDSEWPERVIAITCGSSLHSVVSAPKRHYN